MTAIIRTGELKMIDNSNYIVTGFKKTVLDKFPDKEKMLSDEFTLKLEKLLNENANSSKEKMRHLKAQILPGIAAYQVLQTVMSKEDALNTVHGYTEQHALSARKKFKKLLRIPGLYRLVPAMFAKAVGKLFNESAGFSSKEYQTTGGVWRIDMIKCPYHDTCRMYGCPELCTCFCDSDDVTYDNLHKNLLWRRTKTLGRGGDCCDFYLGIKR